MAIESDDIIKILEFAVILRDIGENKRSVECLENKFEVITGGKGWAKFRISDESALIEVNAYFKGNQFSYIDSFLIDGEVFETTDFFPDDVIRICFNGSINKCMEQSFVDAVEKFDTEYHFK